MALLYIGTGVILAVIAFIDWAGRGAVVKSFTGKAPQDNGQTFRGVFFGLWTLSLPLIFLVQWETHPTPPANEMAAYQYGHKVLSDAWAAVAAFFGVIFAVPKP